MNEIVLRTIQNIPVEITTGEALLFNSLPTIEVISTLQHIIHNESNPAIISRAFDALLKLNNFDKVQFLMDLLDKYPNQWAFTCCQELSNFQGDRGMAKLSELAIKNSDPNIRLVAVQVLALIGNETVIEILEQIKTTDVGEDYEGFKIAETAEKAIKQIQQRFPNT